jgi:endothelin-converting enzyme
VPRSVNDTVCMTASCVHAASELLYTLSPDYKNIDPCTNFDQLVCEGWQERHELRSDQSRISSFDNIAEASESMLKRILEGDSAPSSRVS